MTEIIIRPEACPCCERWTKAVEGWKSYDAGPATIFGFLPLVNRCNLESCETKDCTQAGFHLVCNGPNSAFGNPEVPK